jgi:hypothetical protein
MTDYVRTRFFEASNKNAVTITAYEPIRIARVVVYGNFHWIDHA